MSQEKLMSQGKLLWQLQELKREEAALQNTEELRALLKNLKVLQGKVQKGEKETEALLQGISEGEKQIEELEQKVNKLLEQTKGSKGKLYDPKGGSSKELLSLQQSVLKMEEQSKETEKMYWEITQKIEEYRQKKEEMKEAVKIWKREYNEGVREYKRIKTQLELKLAEVKSKQAEVREQLSSEAIRLYELAEKRYPLNFVAMLKKGTCTGCRISVPFMLVKEVKEGKGFYHCDNCGRLLINPF